MVLPTQTRHHIAAAKVGSTGELENPSRFNLTHESDAPIHAVVVEVEPCTASFIIRTTPIRDPHLEEDIPSLDTRTCLESLQIDDEVEIDIEITRRWLSSEVKSYAVSRIGDCDLSGHDILAVLSSGFCDAWSL